MVDRIPTKPNRYAVYDDAHNFIRYEYHERADEPTQAGDALNKANLLPDAVAALYGLGPDALPRDVLQIIAANLIQSPPLYPKELLNLSNQSLPANTLKSFTLTDNLKNYDLIYISISTSAPGAGTDDIYLWFGSTQVPGISSRTTRNNLFHLVIYRNKSELVSGTGLVPCVYSNYSIAGILPFTASLLNTNNVGLYCENAKAGISISVRGVML